MKFYYNPQDAYLAHQTTIKQLLGTHDVEYAKLSAIQRTVANNKLLSLIKHVHDTTGKPGFLLYDFGLLHDANLFIQQSTNQQLQESVNIYVENQINYLAGYAVSQSTPYDVFLKWAETEAKNVGCPADKVICTSYYETCKDPVLQQELNTALILQNTLNSRDILQSGIGINNGLRLAALYDSSFIQESSRVLLEKMCDDVLGEIPEHNKFLSQLASTELGEIFALNQDKTHTMENRARQWEEEQRVYITNLLKQAKREAIRQSRLSDE